MAVMITKDALVGLGKWEDFRKLTNYTAIEATGDDEFIIDEDDAKKLGLI